MKKWLGLRDRLVEIAKVLKRFPWMEAKPEFSRYETHEEKMREVYRPKGLLAYTTAARGYAKML